LPVQRPYWPVSAHSQALCYAHNHFMTVLKNAGVLSVINHVCVKVAHHVSTAHNLEPFDVIWWQTLSADWR
jgi:hypothetical protein